MNMRLRDYQEAAVDIGIFKYFAEHSGNPIIAMPTGTGKSIVIAEAIRRALHGWPNQRILKLTHVKELIAQNFKTLLRHWPTAPAGIYSSGLNRRDLHNKITFCGIASVHDRAEEFGHVDLVFIDECHLLSEKHKTMYRKFLTALQKINKRVKVVGFTATPFRLGQGMLTEGEDSLFDDISFDLCNLEAFNWLVDEGYLCKLIPKRTATVVDLSKVGTRQGEFKEEDLQQAMDIEHITRAAINECIQVAPDRKVWLVFGTGIQHVMNISRIMSEMGVATTYVHSKMKDAERDKNIADFKAGKYQAMVNNGILTTGFDHPPIDLIVMLRPTKSSGLWVQMLGRGTRPFYVNGFDLFTPEGRCAAINASDKPNCLVLDFAGNTRRCGPINDPLIPKRKGSGGGGEAPVKECPTCGTYNHASVRNCIACGYEFPKIVKFQATASTDDIMRLTVPKMEWFDVTHVTNQPHRKPDKPDSVAMHFICGLKVFKDFLMFEHQGLPRDKSVHWWRKHVGTPVPDTTREALRRMHDEVPKLKRILVWTNTKYPEVRDYDFSS